MLALLPIASRQILVALDRNVQCHYDLDLHSGRNGPFAPLTPALSPLRGEGSRCASHARHWTHQAAASRASLSPQRGEGRGEGCEWPIASNSAGRPHSFERFLVALALPVRT